MPDDAPSRSGEAPRAENERRAAEGGRAGGGLSQSCLMRGAVALSVLLVVGTGLLAWWWMQRPPLSEAKVQQAVVATLQREVPSSFLVTGKLQTTVTSTITNDKIFLPGVLDFNVGTIETTARVPGTIHYGFDVSQLRAEDIRVAGDTVTVTLPALAVHSVEPNLRRMQVRTESGWTRMYDDSRARTREAALSVAQDALTKQGRQHLADSRQPRYNTAQAMEAMLTPVLKAAGARDPVLHFRAEGEALPRVQPPTG